ncbi:hypothetical protein [Nocardia ignorata]|nr:hypothetical protein [Nocardia ignorata]
MALFSQIEQRMGGGHGRRAVVQYLSSEVVEYLHGSYPSDTVRRDMFSAAAEMAYLAGWMAFDNDEHSAAQRYFMTATKLAVEAENAPLTGHILRAMAHQAVDLGHPAEGLQLAEVSVAGSRYSTATPRERALLKIVHAKALSAAGRHREAAKAVIVAEQDFASSSISVSEPSRMFFFTEASLAHETACVLRDSGDLEGAAEQFERSVRKRKAQAFARTHAVTLGYLGAIQARQGDLEKACATWDSALSSMEQVQSGRTRAVARGIRAAVAPHRDSTVPGVVEVENRASEYLQAQRE